MVMCDGCHEWYHEQCEVIPIAAWTDPALKWYCGLCKLAAQLHLFLTFGLDWIGTLILPGEAFSHEATLPGTQTTLPSN